MRRTATSRRNYEPCRPPQHSRMDPSIHIISRLRWSRQSWFQIIDMVDGPHSTRESLNGPAGTKCNIGDNKGRGTGSPIGEDCMYDAMPCHVKSYAFHFPAPAYETRALASVGRSPDPHAIPQPGWIHLPWLCSVGLPPTFAQRSRPTDTLRQGRCGWYFLEW